MSLASEALFDGHPVAHIVAFYDRLRALRIERARIRAVAARQWAALPDHTRAKDAARLHLVAMPADRRAALEQEWQA